MSTPGRNQCARPGCGGQPGRMTFCPRCWREIPEDLKARWKWAYAEGDMMDREAVHAEIRHVLDDG